MTSWEQSKLVHFFRFHRSGFALLSLGVGIITGLSCVAFHYLIAGWSWLMTGYTAYDVDHVPANGHFPWMLPVFLIAVPVISGLLYGPVIHKWAPSARGHGIPEVMLAVQRKGGYIPGAVAVVKLFASALTIGGGGSAGREGPVVQIGAALGSWWSRLVHLDGWRVKMLVACGAAAGIAATFNAPLAGAVFALEVVLSAFTAEAFGMVVVATVGAAVVSHLILGDNLLVQLPHNVALLATSDFFWVAVLGILGGMAGVGFSKLLYLVEDGIDWVWKRTHLPEWSRPAVLGVVLGLGLLLFPVMYGSGPETQSLMFQGHFSAGTLLLLMAGRALFTSYTIGIGGSGGVFAPTLFIGAALGCAFGQVLDPVLASEVQTFGVIAMGAAFAGAARAPISAVLIIMEMTGQYSLVLPLMLAVSLAAGVSHFLTQRTIYTEKLLRRGDLLDDPVSNTLLGRHKASEIMEPLPAVVYASDQVADVASVLSELHLKEVPVVDGPQTRRYQGSVGALDLALARAHGFSDNTPVQELACADIHCAPDDPPSTILAMLLDHDAQGVAVVDKGVLVGWISEHSLVARMHRQQLRALKDARPESSWGSRFLAKEHHLPAVLHFHTAGGAATGRDGDGGPQEPSGSASPSSGENCHS